MNRLTNKNILITGGNSGIGLAAAQEFDREGARVAICGLNEKTLKAAQETLGAGSLAVRADVMPANSTTAEERLAKLGIRLPEAPTPLGAYEPAVQTGNLLFLSGMLATSGH